MRTEHPRILVIDDEPNALEVLSHLLRQNGYEVLLAPDGARGLQRALTEQPDLILLDVIMPGVDGFATCRQLKTSAQTKDIPVIFMTALVETAEKVEGFASGAVDYLTKPLAPEEVLARVNTHLTARRLYQNLHGEIQALVGKLTDVSRQMSELQFNLSRTLPHELRTPLNAILGFSKFLMTLAPEQCADPERILPIRSAIYHSALRMQRLIENYLLYAELRLLEYHPEKSKRELWQSTERLALKPVLCHLAAAKAERAQRAADLRLHILDGEVPMSEKSLQKIADELLDNALKFSAPGTPVDLRAEITPQGWVLRVADQGRGMTAGQIAEIGAFIQFERAYYEQQGSGLGLTLARLLTELNGGKLTIASVPQQGTTVTVAFDRLEKSS